MKVGTKGVALAAGYLLAQARAVQALSKSSRLTVEVSFRHCRPSICMLVLRCSRGCSESNESMIRWQVIAESYTGSVFTNIVGEDFYNAYQNITAVGLRVFEPGTEHIPGLLVGAHFDSTIGTPGEHPAAAQIHAAPASQASLLPLARPACPHLACSSKACDCLYRRIRLRILHGSCSGGCPGSCHGSRGQTPSACRCTILQVQEQATQHSIQGNLRAAVKVMLEEAK